MVLLVHWGSEMEQAGDFGASERKLFLWICCAGPSRELRSKDPLAASTSRLWNDANQTISYFSMFHLLV